MPDKYKRLIHYHVHYVPCSAHSLNLAETCAAESCPADISFFAAVQNVYTFFAALTHRWKILLQKLADYSAHKLELKRLSETRWSDRAKATRALLKGHRCIDFALYELKCDSGTPAVRHEAPTNDIPRLRMI